MLKSFGETAGQLFCKTPLSDCFHIRKCNLAQCDAWKAENY